MVTRRWVLGWAVVLGLGAPMLASGAEPPALVTHEQVRKRLSDKALRLLDVRPRADYEKGHIPGAVSVDTKGASALASKPGGLSDQAAWGAWVEPLGIADGQEVLVYGGKSPIEAARVWWLLRYLGAERVGLIDGGFPLWAAGNRPVSSEATAVAPGKFRVRLDRGRLATKEDVLAALKSGSETVVDARSVGEYTGSDKSSKRGGHVPSACRVEWSDLIDGEGRFLAEATLRSKFGKAGVKAGGPVITHCQGGGRASLDAFVLERLGFPTRNYYLGWSDWGNVEETPVAEGEKP